MNRVIVVFGGAFNPPTNSHFSLSEQICSEYEEIEKVIFVPVSDKYPKEDLLPAEHRVEMLRKVCEKNNKFSVSTIEGDVYNSRIIGVLYSCRLCLKSIN